MKKNLFHELKVGLAALAILAMFAASSTSLGPEEASAQQPSPLNCGCMDVVLVVDDTGSMGPAINNVKLGLGDIVNAANAASGGDLRMGLVTFKDNIEVDQPLTEVIADVTHAINALVAPPLTGEDEPEASDEAVRYAATGATLDGTCAVLTPQGQALGPFRGECVKIIVLITDSTPGGCDDSYNEAPFPPPHDDVNAQDAASAAAAGGIIISPVLVDNGSILTPGHPGGVEPDVMKAYADTTGGVFVTVPAEGSGIAAAIAKIIESCGSGVAAFLVIDEDSIGNGNPPDFFKARDVNDNIAKIGLRAPLPAFNGANVGTTKFLHTGQVGDEGWFALKTIPQSWNDAGPEADGLINFLMAGPGLGTADPKGDREAFLDSIPDVTPLRATGLTGLIGRNVCAVVFDSDISMNYKPLRGSLKGANLGIVAFKVLDVTRLTGYSSSSLPKVEIEILDPTIACAGPLTLYTDAPAPKSSSKPFDVVP